MRLPSKFAVQLARLSPRDAGFIYNEADGHLGHLIGVYFFDTSQRPEWDFIARASSRMGDRTARPPSHVHPQGTTYPARTRSSVLDKRVNDFDIRDHVHVTDLTEPGWGVTREPLTT